MGKLGGVTVLILVLVVMFFRQAIGLYVDWLWFQDVGYGQLFGTILSYKFVLGASAGVLLGLLIYINLKIASSSSGGFRYSSPENIIELPPPELIDPILKRLLLPGALLIGLMAAPQGAASWEQLLLFLNSTSFNLPDPQFGRDVSFYVFIVPWLQVVYHWGIFAIGLTAAASAAVYLVYRGIEYTARGLILGERARCHLLILLGVFLLIKACGYYLDAFDLLHAPRGVSFGASYADIYGTLPALRVLTTSV